MKLETFTFGPFGTNTYVVSDEQGNVLLIDPACFYPYEQQQLLNCIEKLTANSQKPIAILATHGHLDHLWGAPWACEQWNTPVLMHPLDIPMATAMQQQYNLFGIPATAQPFPMEPLANSQQLIANSQLIHTPGHTPGSICLYNEKESLLFSGDTLFNGGYGRTDLPGGSTAQLIASLEKLNRLPSGTLVYPGHGDTTVITHR
jgi:glyoxylase-like metal-dependent hydrolase (beta-lactamase superfamily II)